VKITAGDLTVTKRNGKTFFGNRAISPVLSSVILTGTIIALISATLVFANNFLWAEVAEGEFNSAKQFMQTIGLEIDDVAWMLGRTGTIRYSSTYGDVYLYSSVLNYTVYVQTESTYEPFFSKEVGVLVFNLPTSRFTMAGNFYELLVPSTNGSLVLKGSGTPVARVFAVEKLSMGDGSYIRVVVAPSIRFMNSTITLAGNSTYYSKLYLPTLTPGNAPRLIQAVTLRGEGVEAQTLSGVKSINVTVTFPDPEGRGFDASFFKFPLYEVIDVPDNSVLDVYVGEVEVEFGIDD
jgi:hypothetical protein